MKKAFVLFVLVGVVFFFAIKFFSAKENNVATPSRDSYRHIDLTLGQETFDTLVSDTQKLRVNGLSNFESLASNEAMLFVFGNEGFWDIWMKDMKFPIDIVWADSNKRVVSFETNISPATFPNTFSPKGKALYVIELPAGTLSRASLKVGDILVFNER